MFLGKYISWSEAAGSAIPMQEGVVLHIEEHVLFTADEITAYEQAHPASPWITDLAAISQLKDGELIYISEIGPTLWTREDFGDWLKLNSQNLAADPQKAKTVLMEMARGGTVPRISSQSHERIRNSFMASMTGHLSEAEYFMNKVNQLGSSPSDRLSTFDLRTQPHENQRRQFMDQFLKPIADIPKNISNVKPEDQSLFLWASESIERNRNRRQAEGDMREASPSLRINFELDTSHHADPKIESPEDLYGIKDDNTALQIIRIVLREALVRRKMVRDADGKPTPLGQTVSEDDIFLFATFPELTPYWKTVIQWPNRIRSFTLGPQSDSYKLPDLTVTDKKDKCSIYIGRTHWGMDDSHEPIGFLLEMTTFNEEKHDYNFVNRCEQTRFIEWLNREWAAFTHATKLSAKPAPEFEVDEDKSRMTLISRKISDVKIIGFYIYLLQKYLK
jgi:hypothetical protein